MTDNAYQHVAALDDPAKPHRRVWLCPATGIHVKTHCIAMPAPFGALVWRITGSWCDAFGKANDHDGAAAILAHEHQYQVLSDRAVDLESELEAEQRYMVAKVENAALNLQKARALSARA